MSSNTTNNRYYLIDETGAHREVVDWKKLVSDMTGYQIIEADRQGWINWTPGEMPTGKYDRVDVILGDGIEVHDLVAHVVDWECIDSPDNSPIAYRPCRAPVENGWNRLDQIRPPVKRMVMFVAIGIGPRGDYSTDPYCGWVLDGEIMRWPHEFQPTHWMNIPRLPEKE